jgi:hemerythrin-like metal-binding protein
LRAINTDGNPGAWRSLRGDRTFPAIAAKEVKKMGFFKWKDQFSVNIPEMDQQHQKFFALLNKIQDYNATQSRDPAFLDDLFRELCAYVLVHFDEEEKLLEQTGFAGLVEQKQHHQHFREQLIKLRNQHIQGQGSISQSVLNFMRDWFMDHVIQMDQKYGEYFKHH